LEHGEIQQRKALGADHLLTSAFGDRLRKECAHVGQLGQHFELADEPLRHAHSRNSTMRAATSSTEATSSAISILRMEANELMRTGMA